MGRGRGCLPTTAIRYPISPTLRTLIHTTRPTSLSDEVPLNPPLPEVGGDYAGEGDWAHGVDEDVECGEKPSGCCGWEAATPPPQEC